MAEGLHPTHEVLVAAARAAVSGEPVCVRAAESVDDWGVLLATAHLHAITPLVSAWLRKLHVELPDDAALQLRDDVLANGRHNLLRAAELRDLQRGLHAADVSAMWFKGPLLAQQVYGDLGRREFGDLDVLVHWEDLPAAVEVLRGRGYHLDQPLDHLVEAARAGRPELSAAITLVRPRRLCAVDLHTALSNRLGFTLDHGGIWSRRSAVMLAGEPVPTLGADDLVHYLCVHGTQHGWGRLGWVVDVGLAFTRLPVDHQALLARAGQRGSRRMVLLGAALAADVLRMPLPAPLEAAVAGDRAIPDLVARARRVLFGPTDTSLGVVMERYALQLRAWDRTRDRLRHAARATWGITMNDVAVMPLPPRCFPLYHALRPLRVVSTYARTA